MFARSKSKSTVIKGHTGGVRRVAFSDDSCSLLSASDDKTIKVCLDKILYPFFCQLMTTQFAQVWSVAGQKFRQTLSGHSNWVRSAAFNNTGELIVSGGDDKTVRLWDLSQRSCVQKFYDHTGCSKHRLLLACSEMMHDVQACARRSLSPGWSLRRGVQRRHNNQDMGPPHAAVSESPLHLAANRSEPMLSNTVRTRQIASALCSARRGRQQHRHPPLGRFSHLGRLRHGNEGRIQRPRASPTVAPPNPPVAAAAAARPDFDPLE